MRCGFGREIAYCHIFSDVVDFILPNPHSPEHARQRGPAFIGAGAVWSADIPFADPAFAGRKGAGRSMAVDFCSAEDPKSQAGWRPL